MVKNNFTLQNRAENLLLLFTKNADPLMKQTKTKSQETLEFKKTKTSEYFFLLYSFGIRK